MGFLLGCFSVKSVVDNNNIKKDVSTNSGGVGPGAYSVPKEKAVLPKVRNSQKSRSVVPQQQRQVRRSC